MIKPSFDDERTVLAARRVVPLEQIDARVKHRRRWFLGSAFAIAMFLGAVSALISAYFKFRNQPEPEIRTLSVSSVSDPVVENTLPIVESTEEQPPVHVRVVRPKRARPPVRNTDNTDSLSEDEQLRRIRDAVLVDQWQERRERRVERRERRRAQHHDRDLSNINEIFEGRSRRP